MEREKAFVYILESERNGSFYIGVAFDVEKRLNNHNDGAVVATRNKGPWLLRLCQEYENIALAKKVEYKIKQLKRRDYIKQMIEDGNIKIAVK